MKSLIPGLLFFAIGIFVDAFGFLQPLLAVFLSGFFQLTGVLLMVLATRDVPEGPASQLGLEIGPPQAKPPAEPTARKRRLG